MSLKRRAFYIFPLVLLVLSGCAGYSKRALSSGGCSGEERLASWYGKDFHGRKTSSGETYDMHGFSAAHKTLPFGTLLRVTECRSGRTVQVRVNDRGPFVEGRELDLSYGSAKVLGIITEGVARVNIQVVQAPSLAQSSPPVQTVVTAASPAIEDPIENRSGDRIENSPRDQIGAFLVQVGAYQVLENARRVQAEVSRHYPAVYLEPYETNTRKFHRVRVGPFSSEDEALLVAGHIATQIVGQEAFHPLVIRAP